MPIRGPERTDGRAEHAEDENGQGRRQAVQGHGHGEDPPPQAFRSHLLEKKPSTRTRRLGREVDVAAGGDARQVRRLLGL